MTPAPEAEARLKIDELLVAAGWAVQDAGAAHIHAARGVAIREFPLPGYGFADYLLYVDGKAAGVIEAKKVGSTLTGVEVQSAKYTQGLPAGLPRWHNQLPFCYESTGIETRFTNGLDPGPRSRNVFAFHRPENLAKRLDVSIVSAGVPADLGGASLAAETQPSLSMETILLIPLALPSPTEQHQLVAEAEAQVEANLRRADLLRQSILKQALSGQLVPQNPNDEPASVLLERIREQLVAPVKTTKEIPSPRRNAKPTVKAEPKADTPDHVSLDSVLTAILDLMQPSQKYVRAGLADSLGLSTGRWNAAIQELKRRGQVRQVGEKRGARYFR
jgi:hypothetical protein